MPDKLSGETFLYPILGDPITFVKSPQRLTAMFVEREHNGICILCKSQTESWSASCAG
jgi:shikimate dehydrogenase